MKGLPGPTMCLVKNEVARTGVVVSSSGYWGVHQTFGQELGGRSFCLTRQSNLSAL